MDYLYVYVNTVLLVDPVLMYCGNSAKTLSVVTC